MPSRPAWPRRPRLRNRTKGSHHECFEEHRSCGRLAVACAGSTARGLYADGESRSRADQYLRQARCRCARAAGQGSPVGDFAKPQPVLIAERILTMAVRPRSFAGAFVILALLAAPALCVSLLPQAALAQPMSSKAVVDAAKARGVVGEQGDGLLGFVTGS